MNALSSLAGSAAAKVKKSNLMNLLMQLRKYAASNFFQTIVSNKPIRCMQHPYLIHPDLEARDLSSEDTHQRLIEASGKLKLLSVMLPKLKERGHRVLLFSQVRTSVYFQAPY